MATVQTLFLLTVCLSTFISTQSTLLPPAIFGVPLNGTKDSGKDVLSFIHRSYTQFQQFDGAIPWYYKFDLPHVKNATVASLNDYVQRVFRKRGLLETVLFGDFLGINWDGNNSLYMRDFATFMRMLIRDRLPAFPPEPPVFDNEDDAITETICPFENYIFLKSFRHDDVGTKAFLQYYGEYVETLPAFDGPEDDSDVWLPVGGGPLKYPYHYVTTQVHFNPGGYLNGHTVRMSFSTYNKFNFCQKDRLKEWFTKLHGHRKPDSILDMGTGNGISAMEMAKLFPDATVIGIDMAAPYVRFARKYKLALDLINVFFYQGNVESLYYEDNTFDIIQYTYVLHEMPYQNARTVLKEAYRILKPGGVLSGFDVTYWENDFWREFNIETNTWGVEWNDTNPDVLHGPEPYMAEYQHGTKLPHLLKELGFIEVTKIRYSNFDGIYIFQKPDSN
ncbi:uncharacterized protein [Amphiura filiformis]|uniref:uncharacterized protein n=1 Tax=Amphiura filiformis TaxID=82378 RepID=UPI003B21F1DC